MGSRRCDVLMIAWAVRLARLPASSRDRRETRKSPRVATSKHIWTARQGFTAPRSELWWALGAVTSARAPAQHGRPCARLSGAITPEPSRISNNPESGSENTLFNRGVGHVAVSAFLGFRVLGFFRVYYTTLARVTPHSVKVDESTSDYRLKEFDGSKKPSWREDSGFRVFLGFFKGFLGFQGFFRV